MRKKKREQTKEKTRFRKEANKVDREKRKNSDRMWEEVRKKESRLVSMRKRKRENEKCQTSKNFIKHEINLRIEERKFLKGMRRGSLADVRFAFHFTLKFRITLN